MTSLTDTQVVTASGGLVELGYEAITSAKTITATSEAASQAVSSVLTVVCDGSPVAVDFVCPYVAASGNYILTSLYVDGSFLQRVGVHTNNFTGPVHPQARLSLSAGSHTLQIRSHVNTGTGTYQFDPSGSSNGGPGYFRVSKIVTATQWPAVTTGTIICTSSTRPASPFEGQTIYETDTKRSWTRVGSQWVPDDMVFTNEAARDAAITSPTEGMRAYLTAPTVPAATGATTAVPTGITTIYNGSVWVCTTPVGARATSSATTTSTSYVTTLTSDGTAISVTLVTGTTAEISFTAQCQNSAALHTAAMTISVSGATTLAASNTNGIEVNETTAAYNFVLAKHFILTGLTAGTNTFTLNYKTTANTATYARRDLVVRGVA